jgi:hypothetical protein
MEPIIGINWRRTFVSWRKIEVAKRKVMIIGAAQLPMNRNVARLPKAHSSWFFGVAFEARCQHRSRYCSSEDCQGKGCGTNVRTMGELSTSIRCASERLDWKKVNCPSVFAVFDEYLLESWVSDPIYLPHLLTFPLLADESVKEAVKARFEQIEKWLLARGLGIDEENRSRK